MMVASFDYPSVAMPPRKETTEQLHIAFFLSAFVLCLGIGCLLMLPLAPPYRPVGTCYCAALLPLLFTWWGIILPTVTYWLFQQYVSTRWGEAITPQIYGATPKPGIIALNLPTLQSAGRWSSANHQKYEERILHMVRQGEPREASTAATGMDKKRIALPILSRHPWSPCVVRAVVRGWFGKKQHERAPPQTSLNHSNFIHPRISAKTMGIVYRGSETLSSALPQHTRRRR